MKTREGEGAVVVARNSRFREGWQGRRVGGKVWRKGGREEEDEKRKLYSGQCRLLRRAILLFSPARWGCQGRLEACSHGQPSPSCDTADAFNFVIPSPWPSSFCRCRNLFVLRLDAELSWRATSPRQSPSTNQFNRFDKLRANDCCRSGGEPLSFQAILVSLILWPRKKWFKCFHSTH